MEQRAMDETYGTSWRLKLFRSPSHSSLSAIHSWPGYLENLCVIRIGFNRIRCYTPTHGTPIRATPRATDARRGMNRMNAVSEYPAASWRPLGAHSAGHNIEGRPYHCVHVFKGVTHAEI